MNVILGNNDFFGVPFPLVLADRFFHIYATPSGFSVDIFRWDEKTQKAVYEVRGGQPQTDNMSTNPTGIVTVGKPSGGFSYKFRPKPGVSQIFGKVPVDKEFEVVIDDRSIKVMSDGRTACTLEKNQFSGMPIGIRVEANGSIGIGVNWLPPGMVLKRK